MITSAHRQQAQDIFLQIKTKLKLNDTITKNEVESLLSLTEKLEKLLNLSNSSASEISPLVSSNLDDFDDILDQVIIESNIEDITKLPKQLQAKIIAPVKKTFTIQKKNEQNAMVLILCLFFVNFAVCRFKI